MNKKRWMMLCGILWGGGVCALLHYIRGISLSLMWIHIRTEFQYATDKEKKVAVILLVHLSLCLLMLVFRIMSKNKLLELSWHVEIRKKQYNLKTNNFPYSKFIFAISISLFSMIAFTLLRDISADRGRHHFDSIAVAHALGGIGDKAYTNSREALLYNYSLGHRSFEVDFSISSDEMLVCLHDWEQGAMIQGRNDNGKILTKDEFEQGSIYEEYTPISVEELLLFMSEHEDVWIVTDSKELVADLITLEFSYIVDSAKKLGIEKVLDRIVVQIYNPEMYKVVCDVYMFPEIIFTLYRYWDGSVEAFPDICKFCVCNDIENITMWYYLATPEVLKTADEFGVNVYVHTVNDIDTVTSLKTEGVKGFYTDYLSPEIIKCAGL